VRVKAEQARLLLRGDGRVLSVAVSGLVTARTIDAIRQVIAPYAASAGAVWVDYTRSAIAVSDLELQGLVAPIAAGSRSVPMAWAVADDGVAELWSRQALRLALFGHRRFVGRGLAAADLWAQQQALLAPGPAVR